MIDKDALVSGGQWFLQHAGQKTYRLEVPAAPTAIALSVVSFKAVEALGKPYEVTVQLTHPLELDRADYLNRPATFVIDPGDGSEPRRFAGWIPAFSKTRQTRDFHGYEMSMPQNPKRVISPTFVDDNGQTFSVSTMSAASDNVEHVILSKPCIIPVLFLPGIMGTNLRDTQSKKAVWRPPSTDFRGLADALLQLIAYAFTSAQSRAASLLMDRVEVDPNGPIDAGRSGLPINVLTLRGWGTIMRGSYHAFLSNLQYYLNNLARYDFERCKVDFKEWAAEAGTEPPTDWGSEKGEALTRCEILHAARYQFDVWVGGYNWLQSNRDSGERIKAYVEKEILPYYNEGGAILLHDTPDGEGRDSRGMARKKPSRIVAEKVIVVTHSMGGFVSRALTEIHGCDKVLGVSHGVQPATGAPAAYKRMRAGFEGVSQVVLGRNRRGDRRHRQFARGARTPAISRLQRWKTMALCPRTAER